MKRLRLRARRAHSATCFCDACAAVTHCDTAHRIDTARQEALTRSLHR